MHDELIEHRLSATLREEADALPFTITPAELERRLALRRRTFAGRRLTLLLAAAVGISLVGVGGALGGLFSKTPPTLPTSTAPVNPSNAPAAILASLDELVAADSDSVLVAQAHGPAGGPAPLGSAIDLPPDSVTLGEFGGPTDYRVQVACLGEATLELDARVPFSSGPASGPRTACDGSTQLQTLHVDRTESIGFSMSGRASWRIVIRGTPTYTMPLVSNPVLEAPTGQEELVRVDDLAIDESAPTWGDSGRRVFETSSVPGRESYVAKAWCRDGQPIRFFLGDEVGAAIVADTETQVACDGTVHEIDIGLALPDGSRVYVAAAPGQRLSFLVSSTTPPVALTNTLPGWSLDGGFGPDLAFDGHTDSFGGAGVGSDQVQVVLACTGTEPIEVVVDDGTPIGTHQHRFEATCSAEGSTSSETFVVARTGVSVSYFAPKGTWTALSILVPD